MLTWSYLFLAMTALANVPLKPDTEVVGGLALGQVQSVLKKNINPMRYCAEEQFHKSDIFPTGTVHLTIEVNPTGTVKSQAAEPSVGMNAQHSFLVCIERSVKALKFPKVSKPSVIKTMLSFAQQRTPD